MTYGNLYFSKIRRSTFTITCCTDKEGKIETSRFPCTSFIWVCFFPLQLMKCLLAQEIKSSSTILQCASKPVVPLLMVKSTACKTLLLWMAVAAQIIHTWIIRIRVCPSPNAHAITRGRIWNLGITLQRMESVGMYYCIFLFVGIKPLLKLLF